MTRIDANFVRSVISEKEIDYELAVESFLNDVVLVEFTRKMTNTVTIEITSLKVPSQILIKSLEARGFSTAFNSHRNESYMTISV